MLLSFVLFLIGLLTTNNRPRNHISSLFASFISFMFFIFTIIYIVADYFTDEGINDAVIYHIVYGVEGAGFEEYSLIILVTIVLFLVSFVASYLHYRIIKNSTHPSPKKIKVVISKFFLLAALVTHPTMDAFWNLYTFNSAKKNYTDNLKIKEDFSDYYLTPQIKSISNEHPNLIYIYAESLERTYFNQELFPGLIKGLRNIESENISFLDIQQVAGTGWTIAGMVSTQCGLPLVTPSHGNSMSGMDTFYDGATCIGNLLDNEGYYLSMLQGSSIKFSGIETFYKTHNFDTIRGKSILISKLDDETYLNHWGLYDDSLLKIAFQEFETLSRSEKNFALFIPTLDTHHPKGHLSKECKDIKYQDGSNAILNAVHCSDFMLSNFIRKIQASDYGNKTVIVITSDHLAMRNTATDLLNQGNRKNLFIIIDPRNKENPKEIVKTGSTLDIGPTILDTLGFNTSLGLGRNLLRDDVSLVTQIKNFNGHLKNWSPEISKFWNFKKINTDIEINKEQEIIHIGDSVYKFPILLKLDKELSGIPFFEFNSPTKLYQHLMNFDKDELFIWIDNCSKINTIDHKLGNTDSCFLIGKMGGKTIGSELKENDSTIPLGYIREINKEIGESEVFEKRHNTLSKLEKKLGVIFYEKVYRKLLKIYQKLKHYIKTQYRNLIVYMEEPSEIEQVKICKKNQKIYQQDKHVVNRFIAHAGGQIDGHNYTDSLEALNLSYNKGFRLFELDIIKTSDNIYVAAHDWEHWAKATGYLGDLPPDRQTFKDQKIYNKYTSMDMNDINQWFKDHPDAILITDKINAPSDFSKKFIDKNRLMMELFTWDAVKQGINAKIRSSMPTGSILGKIKGNKISYLKKLGITDIACSRRIIYGQKDLVSDIVNAGINIYAFHVNFDKGKDEKYVVCNELDYFYGMYADKWDFNNTLDCDQQSVGF